MDSFPHSDIGDSVQVPMHELTAQQINQLDPFRYVLKSFFIFAKDIYLVPYFQDQLSPNYSLAWIIGFY